MTCERFPHCSGECAKGLQCDPWPPPPRTPIREMVWANAYAADFARQFAEIRSATDSVPTRDELAAGMVDVKRCKVVADAAAEGMG